MSTNQSPVAPPAESHYRVEGRLHLQFDVNGPRTVMNVLAQHAPLKVVRAFEQDSGAALVHLHNVSGGILGGDLLDYEVEVKAGAQVQLTTTGATRIYRQREGMPAAVQKTRVTIETGGLLELVPDPVIPFAGSAYRQETHIELADGAGVFWWETIMPGRATRGELFQYNELALVTSIRAAGRPIALENASLEPAVRPLASSVRLGPYSCFSTFYVCKVGVEQARWLALESQLRAMAGSLSQPGQIIWGISSLVAHGLVIRGLSTNSRSLTRALPEFWQAAKLALYGCPAILPRKVY